MAYKRSKEESDEYHKNHVEKYGREYINHRNRDYREKNKGHLNECRRKNYQKHREERCEQNRIKRKKLKNKVFEKLGNKCAQCGFSDTRALQIDHINGDGHEERTLQKDTWKYYNHILKSIENGENRYQLLCANCNWIKRIENHETN